MYVYIYYVYIYINDEFLLKADLSSGLMFSKLVALNMRSQLALNKTLSVTPPPPTCR